MRPKFEKKFATVLKCWKDRLQTGIFSVWFVNKYAISERFFCNFKYKRPMKIWKDMGLELQAKFLNLQSINQWKIMDEKNVYTVEKKTAYKIQSHAWWAKD